MLDRQKTFEREALLKRLREIQADLAKIERNLREGEARLPVEEQLRLKLRRFIEANIPKLTSRFQLRNAASRSLNLSFCSPFVRLAL